jgi:hypothetical protein
MWRLLKNNNLGVLIKDYEGNTFSEQMEPFCEASFFSGDRKDLYNYSSVQSVIDYLSVNRFSRPITLSHVFWGTP